MSTEYRFSVTKANFQTQYCKSVAKPMDFEPPIPHTIHSIVDTIKQSQK